MMFKEKSISKLYAYALAAVFALTLAGCGGGGGTAAVEEETSAMPTQQEMCEGDGGRYNADGSCSSAAEVAEEGALSGAQEAAMMAYMKAKDYVESAVDPVAMSNAYKYAAMAKEASDAAEMATTSAMAMTHQTAAEKYRDMAMEAGMKRGLGITMLANKITNQQMINNAVLEGKTGDAVPKPVSNAMRVGTALAASAAAVATVGNTPTVTTVTPNIAEVTGGSVSQGRTVAETPAALAASARATYNASGPRLTVTLDSANADAVTRGEEPVSLTMRGGWMGTELVGKSPDTGTVTSMTYANVYTDIQPTKTVTQYATPSGTATALPTDAGVTAGVTGDIPGDGSDFEGTYNSNIADNAPPVSGLFDCPTAGVCSISVNDDGELVAIQGYEFLPATGTMTMADGDYLAWGVWLRVPTATEAANVAATGAFASGIDVFTVNARLKDSATYNGVATGLYSAGGMVEYFDADVSLTANFGGTVGADSDDDTSDSEGDDLLGAVTGTVSGIKAGGIDVEGMLTLKKANIIDGDDSGTHAGGFSSTVSGTLAGRTMVGNWGGQFYGPSSATGTAAQTQYPTTAAGTFGASAPGNVNDPIRILGSFGTWKAE